jgi:molybdopterin-containing oxidoreductase family membrane subunit
VDCLLPDFAMLRDRAITPFNKRVYSILSFGWSGRAKDWQRFEEVSLVLAGLHLLYFLYILLYRWILLLCNTWMAYSLFLLILLLVLFFRICDGKYFIIMRKVSNLEAYITIQHIELMNIVI